MLGMIALMPSISFSRDRQQDSLTICRIWEFQERYAQMPHDTATNVYMVYSYDAKRRNALLYIVPTMYRIARGERAHIGESYNKVQLHNVNDFDVHRQVVSGTIPHHASVMPTIKAMAMPNLYGIQLFRERLLLPFHRSNRFFYKYRVSYAGHRAYVYFRPRSGNTQLVKGVAEIDPVTGRIISTSFKGYYDMIGFHVNVSMDEKHPHSIIPVECANDVTFKFLGNHIDATLHGFYNQPTTLPDSIHNYANDTLMASLRAVPLTAYQRELYTQHEIQEQLREKKEEQRDSTEERYIHIKDKAWDIIGEHLINSTTATAGATSVYVSPLFNPLYMSYSSSKGISYKLQLGMQYNWDNHHFLSFSPEMGYSFKVDQLYYSLPLRMTYNPHRNGFTELVVANGNRTSNALLYDDYQKAMGENASMPYFKDSYIQMYNNIKAFKWLEIVTGLIYHRRWSSDIPLMQEAGLPYEYRSFAPQFTIRVTPWSNGPTLAANYEQSISNLFRSNLRYERWEFDGVYKHISKGVRIFNFRVGTGFYTQRSTDYFVDFSNFRDNNLPSGWEDDWSGQFQMADSRWYNESNYYLRGHVSYDSPLVMLSWLPFVGNMVETERLYLSALNIKHTRPYIELGYGFRTRFFSTGLFAGFLGKQYHSFSCKFTFELFRRW